MAGDWIKMRIDLQSHPKIVRILSAARPHDVGTVTDKFRVIGGLHAVWTIFDVHSEDGVLPGYTPEILDHIIGWEGFSVAMMSVGWLEHGPGDVLKMPEFQEHNGKSAKRRAEDQKRKKASRNGPQSVRNLSADGADKTRTREEKRREDKRDIGFTPPGVEEVRSRITEMGYCHVAADNFVNFYASKNWKVGKTKMTDWKAALAGWESRNKSDTESLSTKSNSFAGAV